jgi:hypothetical protein
VNVNALKKKKGLIIGWGGSVLGIYIKFYRDSPLGRILLARRKLLKHAFL